MKARIQPFVLHHISDKPVLSSEQAQVSSGTAHSGEVMNQAVIKRSDYIVLNSYSFKVNLSRSQL